MVRIARVLLVSSLALVGGALGCQKEKAAPPAAPAPAAPQQPPQGQQPQGQQPAAAAAGKVTVAVTEEGFVPARIPAKAGQPITLAITRKTDRTCAKEILFHGQEGKTDLPLNQTVEVTYTPKAAGEVKFGCAMGMMIGGVLAAD